MRGRWALPAGLSALLLSACSTGAPQVSDTPRRDLAGRPVVAEAVGTSSAAARPTPTSLAAPSPGTASTPTSDTAAGLPSPRAAVPAYRLVVQLDDAGGDQGLGGPAYGDLRSVRVEDDGRQARVTVSVGGALPQHPASRESLGIGVDLYAHASETESDYQLFADGGPDGWFAYLQTPRGFVRYPGTFAVTGGRVVFTVPWSSLGASTALSSFVDWTQGGHAGLTGNPSGHDEAPTLGNRSFSR